MSEHKLVFDKVLKKFGDLVVCQEIDLSVAKSELICLIGASGSGKSTLLRCANLLEPIDDGAILLDGEDISDPTLDPNPIRQRIGMVFQSYNLFPHMTVAENISLAPRRLKGLSKSQANAQAQTLLERFGLGDKAKSYPDRLSGGQQQRVAIARSMAMKPEVLLLDEITSALDPELVGEVLAVVRDLKAQGMTMLLATHEMSFAREVADRVAFLDKGKLLEIAPPDQLFSAPQEPRTREFLSRVLAR